MLEKLRPLRVRVTLFATLAVTAALVAAAVGLVLVVERTLIGRLERAAIDHMNRVADALADGREPPMGRTNPVDVMVQVLDESGEIIQSFHEQSIISAEAPPQPAFSPPPGGLVTGLPTQGQVVVRQVDTKDLILAQRTVDSPEGRRTVVSISPLSEVSRSIDTVIRILWMGIPLLIAVVALVCWYFTGRTLKPVDAMTRRAADISHSTLSGRLPRPETNDEIDRLAVTLNSMLERLEEASQRQHEFVSDASHELRSPISAIKSQLEVALVHPEASSWRAVATNALAESGRMERLVEDLLTLAQAEETASAREPLDLSELVSSETGRLKDARLVLDLDGVVVLGDERQLRRAVANLVENATRYADDRIEVSLRRRDRHVVLAVDDDGPGVRAGERERIFERFTRLDEGRARNHGGIGIGLALVRRVSANHGGQVVCGESRLGGARFEVRLPVDGASPQAG